MLKNKIALITGGTSGMGAATAKRFQAEGATVIVTGSNGGSVEAARKEMPHVEAIVSDAGDPAATKKLVEEIQAMHGPNFGRGTVPPPHSSQHHHSRSNQHADLRQDGPKPRTDGWFRADDWEASIGAAGRA